MATSARQRSASQHAAASSPSKARKPNRKKLAKPQSSSPADRRTAIELPPLSTSIDPIAGKSAEPPPPPLGEETIKGNAFDPTHVDKGNAERPAFTALFTDLSIAAADHLARYSYATAGRALRVAGHSARIAAQAIELAGAYSTSASLATKLVANAFSFSREITLLALASEESLARLVGNVSANAAATPFRVAASQLT